MKLRGHDGAVQAIAYDLAMIVAYDQGKLTPGAFERRPCLLWTPPPPPPKPTLFQRLVWLCGLTRAGSSTKL